MANWNKCYISIITAHNRAFGNSFIDLRYHKEMIDDCNGVVWNNLYKHELVEMLRFPEGVFYKDNAFIYPIFTNIERL